ncbi:MAG TPA: hypothetical protein DEO38_00570 [Bacteroidales bacterium]|nr:hypothetical protein [Bacteroidales bacterium]
MLAEKHILLYFRDANLSSLLAEYLHSHGVASTMLDINSNIVTALLSDNYHVLLMELDPSIPSHLSDLRAIRLVSDRLPLLMIASADTSAQMAIDAYQCGADIVLRRPFSLEELWYRLQGCFRLYAVFERQIRPMSYDIGSWHFDVENRALYNAQGQKVTQLTPIETKILDLLYSYVGTYVSRTLILRSVWHHDFSSHSGSLDVYITRLRNLLARQQGVSIVAIRSLGYRLVLPR